MLTSLYLMNEKNEKLDLLCSPFWLEIESFKQEYVQSFESVQMYQNIYSNQNKRLNSHVFELEGTALKIGESKQVDSFVNREGSTFRLFKVDDAGNEHFCEVNFLSYATTRIARTDKFVQLLKLEKISNWLREVRFNSVENVVDQTDETYDYEYDFTYGQEEISESYNPSETFEVTGDEPAPFYLVIPSGGTNLSWTATHETLGFVGSGKIVGTFGGTVIIDTRTNSQGIFSNGTDLRDSRDLSQQYDHFFNLPVGKNVINITGTSGQRWYGYFVEQDRLVTSDEY